MDNDDIQFEAPDFVDAVNKFRSAVKEFTAAVQVLDSSIAVAVETFGARRPYPLERHDI
jgi:hypothetical protein